MIFMICKQNEWNEWMFNDTPARNLSGIGCQNTVDA